MKISSENMQLRDGLGRLRTCQMIGKTEDASKERAREIVSPGERYLQAMTARLQIVDDQDSWLSASFDLSTHQQEL